MGDAAVSALVKDVLARLTSELIKEFALFRGFKGDILALKEDFEQIEAVLEDAEEKQVKEKAVELWLRRLRSASLKVEDVLDEVKTEALLQRLYKEIGIRYKVRALFSKVKFRVRAPHKVKAIRTKLDDIASRRFELNLISSDTSHVDVGVEGEMPNRETSSLILDSSNILGRDKEVEMLTRTICNKDKVLILCHCVHLCKLPESICKLKYLKYMTVLGSCIEALPTGLKDMISLQRLDINYCLLLGHLPPGIEKLTSLRMLPRFPVGNERAAKISELRGLNLLEGKLEIEGLENVGGLNEAKSANLICKTKLSVLKLHWSDELTIFRLKRPRVPEMLPYIEEVLEGLEPNPSLEILELNGYMGKTISPSWMENLRNLVEIVFHGCKKCEHIPPLGRLPSLRVIQLWYMYSLKCFHDDDTNMSIDNTDMFICLQKLDIFSCPKLVSLPSNLPKHKVLISWY